MKNSNENNYCKKPCCMAINYDNHTFFKVYFKLYKFIVQSKIINK